MAWPLIEPRFFVFHDFFMYFFFPPLRSRISVNIKSQRNTTQKIELRSPHVALCEKCWFSIIGGDNKDMRAISARQWAWWTSLRSTFQNPAKKKARRSSLSGCATKMVSIVAPKLDTIWLSGRIVYRTASLTWKNYWKAMKYHSMTIHYDGNKYCIIQPSIQYEGSSRCIYKTNNWLEH